MFPFIVLFAVVYLIIAATFFYVMTTSVFVVEIGSGIYYFAVLLYILLLITSLIFEFHSRFDRFPPHTKFVVGILIVILSLTCFFLGLRFRPFLDVRVHEKLGAFLEDILPPSKDNFPPAKAEAFILAPPPLNQGRAGTCWAYAGALALSVIKNTKLQKKQSVKISCAEKSDVSEWSVSPQALIDLYSSSNKVGGAPVSEAFSIASAYALPSLGCVNGYTAKYNGAVSSCVCNAPKSQWCLLRSTGANEHATCSDGQLTDKSTILNGLRKIRLSGVSAMERAISSGRPVIVWLSFKSQGYPLWAGVESDGISLLFRSPGFICRPKDEQNYTVDTSGIGHAVCIIAFGTREDGVPYWEIQNSWGDNWGNNGKIKIEKGVNAWGIELYPTTFA